MSTPKIPKPVKLIASFLSPEKEAINEGIVRMVELYGEADFVSGFEPFAFTNYYQKELGEPLLRRFVAFRELVAPDILPAVKIQTNTIEDGLRRADNSRRLNIDPGYIAFQHLILATGKGFAHRPYLGSGIYADLTLIFRDGAYHPLEWTYPDYASPGVRKMFEKIRAAYWLTMKLGEKSQNGERNLTMAAAASGKRKNPQEEKGEGKEE